jgi:hypothetical protein
MTAITKAEIIAAFIAAEFMMGESRLPEKEAMVSAKYVVASSVIKRTHTIAMIQPHKPFAIFNKVRLISNI